MMRSAPLLRRVVARSIAWLRWKLLPGHPAPGLLINEGEFRPQVREALRTLQQHETAEQIGDYLEFGVCNGTSLRFVYDELRDAGLDHVRLFGFDSFAGLPPDDEGVWAEGSFDVDYDEVVQSLSDHGIDWKRVTLVKGFYRDSLTDALVAEHGLRKASLIMIDCDLYSSTTCRLLCSRIELSHCMPARAGRVLAV